MMAEEWVGWGKKSAAPAPQADVDWTGWGKKRKPAEIPAPASNELQLNPAEAVAWEQNQREGLEQYNGIPAEGNWKLAISDGVTPHIYPDPNYNPDPPDITPEVAADERRLQSLGNLPLPVQRMLEESGRVNPRVGTLEDSPGLPGPVEALLRVLPSRGPLRALKTGAVQYAGDVIEPLANIAAGATGLDIAGPPEGLAGVYQMTDPPQTDTERIADVAGRIGAIPAEFASMGGANPIGMATQGIGKAAAASRLPWMKLPAELAAFTAAKEAGNVAAQGQDVGSAAANIAMSTPHMVMGAAESIPAAGLAAARGDITGAIEAGEPALALAALAGKDKVGGWLKNRVVPWLRRQIGERANSVRPVDQGGNRHVEPPVVPKVTQDVIAPTQTPIQIQAEGPPALTLTPQQIEAGLRGGAITDAPIDVAPKPRQVPPFFRKQNYAPPAQEAGPVAAAPEAGKVAGETKVPPFFKPQGATDANTNDAAARTGTGDSVSARVQVATDPTNAAPSVAANEPSRAGPTAQNTTTTGQALPQGYAVEKTLPGRVMTEAEIKASQKKKYNRGSRDESLAAAIGVATRTGKPAYVYATNAGFKVESEMPSLPSGNRFFEVTSDGKSYGGRILTVGESSIPRTDTPGPVTPQSDAVAAPGPVVKPVPSSEAGGQAAPAPPAGPLSFADAKDGDIYTINVKSRGQQFAVRDAVENPKGYGDAFFATEAEALKERDLQMTRRSEKQARTERLDAEAKKAAEAQAVKEDIDGFDTGMTPLQRGKAIAALNSQRRSQGKIVTVKDIVRQAVSEGDRIITVAGEKALGDAVKGFRTQKQIGAIGLKYAEYLLNKTKNTDPTPKGGDPREAKETPQAQVLETPVQTPARVQGESPAPGASAEPVFDPSRIPDEIDPEASSGVTLTSGPNIPKGLKFLRTGAQMASDAAARAKYVGAAAYQPGQRLLAMTSRSDAGQSVNNKLSKAARDVTAQIRDVADKQTQFRAKYLPRVDKIVEGLTPAERENMVLAFGERESAKSPKVEAAVNKLREFDQETTAVAVGAGMLDAEGEPWRPLERGWVPQQWNKKAVKQIQHESGPFWDKAVQVVSDALKAKKLKIDADGQAVAADRVAADPKAQAIRWLQKNRERLASAQEEPIPDPLAKPTPPLVKPGTSSVQLHKLIDWPREFLADDLVQSMVEHKQKLLRKASEALIFGPRHENLRAAAKQAIADAENAARKRGGNVTEAGQRTRELIQDWYRAEVGLTPKAKGEGAARAATMTSAALHLSAGSAFPAVNALQGAMSTMLHYGLLRGSRAYAESLPAFLKGGKRYAEAKSSGVLDYSGLAYEMRQLNIPAVAKDLLSGFAERVEAVNRTAAMIAGERWANSFIRRHNKTYKTNGHRLSVEPIVQSGDYRQMRRVFNQAEIFDMIRLGQMNPEQMGKLQRGASELSQYLARPQDLPLWMSHPYGRVVGQFWGMAYKEMQNGIGWTLKEAGHGNLIPMARFMLLAPAAGFAADRVRQLLYGARPNDDDKSKLAKALGYVANASGLLDRGFDVIESGNKWLDTAQQRIEPVAMHDAGQILQAVQSIIAEYTKAGGKPATGWRKLLRVSSPGKTIDNALVKKGVYAPMWWKRKAPYNPANAAKRERELARKKARDAAKGR